MLLEAVLFSVIILVKERRVVQWPSAAAAEANTDDQEDDDVTRERQMIQHCAPTEEDVVFIKNLRQQFPDGKVALDSLCLKIPQGECFGYLGINGAGKSTTIKILTGQIAPSSGSATLGGFDMASNPLKARTVMGYCPQFDSLHDLLTVYEQLELYARLKGIPPSMVKQAVEEKIDEVGLREYRDKLTRGLSGGNKRKVSTAIALMGSPQIIFLDEPSTGVDPSSRRKMWDVIASVCAEKRSSVVLTTHSMEECEALCSRVGILVGGKLQCLGSVEHLKQKFGRGYTVEVKLGEPSEAAIGALESKLTTAIREVGQIAAAELEHACALLGDAARYSSFTTEASEQGAVSALRDLLSSNGYVSSSLLCEWWVSESERSALTAAFERRFVGSQLVECEGHHVRVHLPKEGLRPSDVFAFLEQAKSQLNVAEYNVSDTTLEHIFNSMAAQQDTEHPDMQLQFA
ncbi:hypothetical protein PINS_up005328 [Pythium insidiosum]|nr:hypothetical protein PINS_up005328 [Pythium insidiosum]